MDGFALTLGPNNSVWHSFGSVKDLKCSFEAFEPDELLITPWGQQL